ncbi:BadF-type ATPase [Lutibacter agarilyticus]|uniref:BadF-type ATPase n=1 Tax=Lutibacter agarilyticus TaxID=1109740 RepID=A0A238WCH1_9FLAO|nr:N-acetylglucosamine kinase [Lutibacter agarilyticus]SNR44262.1 BadF-type ATPase [Lutibacter agarilyticus]
MLLIADSGSTKCDWVLFKNKDQEPIKIRTKGLNPAILKKEDLAGIILNSAELLQFKNDIKTIYFFGAGCNNLQSITLLENLFHTVFPQSKSIVKEDTMAAVWATTNDPAVVCILGTGSNCCFYDGENIQLKVPAMGYLLMDEGSGNYFGKELLKSYYYNQMPEDLKVAFEQEFSLDENEVIEKLYQNSTPNQYLAEYAVFLFQHKAHPLIKRIIGEGFAKFIDNNILQFKEELKSVPLYFVGSVAFYGQDFLISALKERGIKASRFVKRPIDNVINKIKEANFLDS